MNTRIMAVALVAVSLFGTGAVHAEEVEFVRVLPVDSPHAGSWNFTNRTAVVLGQQDDDTFTFHFSCGGTANDTWKSTDVVVIHAGAGGPDPYRASSPAVQGGCEPHSLVGRHSTQRVCLG